MSAEKKKELQVAALENGTAIDHIPPSQLFKVASLLGLEKMNNTITIGNNFHSNKMGCKGMIKIADKFFEEDEINRIAMIAPNIILNIIRDYEVVEKKTVTLPDELQRAIVLGQGGDVYRLLAYGTGVPLVEGCHVLLVLVLILLVADHNVLFFNVDTKIRQGMGALSLWVT